MRTQRLIRRISGVLALLLALSAAPGWAASTGGGGSSWGGGGPAEDPDLVRARELVGGGEFERAIPLLRAVVKADGENADAYNLLGFSHRKTGRLDAALEYYKKALAIDPRHRGAHEYIGEAYLEMGDVAAARKHLAALDKACFFGCKELDELEAAIVEYEARN